MELDEGGAEQLDDLELSWCSASDVGKIRRLNEDSFLAHPGLFLVADGMGGHAAGDVASGIAVDLFCEQLPSLPLTPAGVEQLVAEANRRVREHAGVEGSNGMGTTLVGLALVDNGGACALMVFNIGDSRCYSWSQDKGLAQVTTDHSVVQELVDAGSITADEAEIHPDRNVVTRAIGVDVTVAADFFVLPRLPHQRFLLCSDGVSGPLRPEMIAECLADEQSPVDGAARLVSHVLEGPATDNATCILVDVRWTDLPDESVESDDDVTGPKPIAQQPTVLIHQVPENPAPLAERVAESPTPISEVPR